MTRFPALRGLRIGCVQYLNSRPLIHALAGCSGPGGPEAPSIHLAHPSALAARLREGALDAALVPVFEALRSPERYQLVRGVAISSRGPVYSVYVAHSEPLEQIQSVLADPASLTSVHLLQVLAAGSLGRPLALMDPAGLPMISEIPRRCGRLLIGNQALEFRLRHGMEGLRFWDLGEAWTEWTGLPFVYAAWVLRRDLPETALVAEAFRDAAAIGVAHAHEIAAQQDDFPRELAVRYLTSHIRFGLGAEEEAGLARFSEELRRGGHLVGARRPLEFV
jgi:predicted solute-binding protein